MSEPLVPLRMRKESLAACQVEYGVLIRQLLAGLSIEYGLPKYVLEYSERHTSRRQPMPCPIQEDSDEPHADTLLTSRLLLLDKVLTHKGARIR